MKKAQRLFSNSSHLDDAEVAEGIEDAILIDCRGDVVSLLLQFVDGITHCNAYASLTNHRRIVASVTKSNGVGSIQPLVLCYGQDAFPFIGSVGSVSLEVVKKYIADQKNV